jgi:hypothetical protein
MNGSPTSSIKTLLWGIWAAGASSVFVVGDGGTIYHFDGTAWTTMSSGVTRRLRRVCGLDDSHVYAVGADGTILFYGCP